MRLKTTTVAYFFRKANAIIRILAIEQLTKKAKSSLKGDRGCVEFC